MDDNQYEIGDYVELPGNRKGHIRYIGNIHSNLGDEYVGIELDEPIIDGNNGTLDKHSHFECSPGKRAFCTKMFNQQKT